MENKRGQSLPLKSSRFLLALQKIKILVEECIESLRHGSELQHNSRKTSGRSTNPRLPDVDFDKPLRPFIKQYSKGMSGPKKFALLLSWLVKGDAKKEIAIQEIQKHWNKMTSRSLLGMDFNHFFPGQAKNNDWVDSKKKGFYTLRPRWRDIFDN